MELKELLKSLSDDERKALSTSCDHSLGHIKNVAQGHKPCSAELAAALDYHSHRLFGEHRTVKRWDLIPTKWWWIWPELIGVEGAPPIPVAANDSTMSVNEAA